MITNIINQNAVMLSFICLFTWMCVKLFNNIQMIEMLRSKDFKFLENMIDDINDKLRVLKLFGGPKLFLLLKIAYHIKECISSCFLTAGIFAILCILFEFPSNIFRTYAVYFILPFSVFHLTEIIIACVGKEEKP